MKINIKIVQGKNEIYVEGSEPKEIIDKLDDINKIVEKLGGLSILPVGQSITHVSQTMIQETVPSELIAQVKPKNMSDKIMLMVYYLSKHGNTDINVNDMRSIFKSVMETPPKNWGVMMNNLLSKGYLMKAPKKENIRTWSMTRSGMDYAERLLTKEVEEG